LGLIAVAAAAVAGCSLLQPEQPQYRYWEPVLSPDGTRIAYSSPIGDAFELFLKDLASGEESHLTRNGYVNWGPSWAPDGTRVVFVSQRDENIDLYIVDVASGEETRLTTHEKEDVNPHWGADGMILFNSSRAETWELYSVDPEELTLERLSPVSTEP
jgi:TolB protein